MADSGTKTRNKNIREKKRIHIRASTKQQQNNITPLPSFILAYKNEQKRNEHKTHTQHTHVPPAQKNARSRYKDKKRYKNKRDNLIRTSTKLQQNNIIPFPSFIFCIQEQTKKEMKNKTHTYSLRRRMADPVTKTRKETRI